jgi:hypothetical protein
MSFRPPQKGLPVVWQLWAFVILLMLEIQRSVCRARSEQAHHLAESLEQESGYIF